MKSCNVAPFEDEMIDLDLNWHMNFDNVFVPKGNVEQYT